MDFYEKKLVHILPCLTWYPGSIPSQLARFDTTLRNSKGTTCRDLIWVSRIRFLLLIVKEKLKYKICKKLQISANLLSFSFTKKMAEVKMHLTWRLVFGVGHRQWILSSKIGRGRARKGNFLVIIVRLLFKDSIGQLLWSIVSFKKAAPIKDDQTHWVMGIRPYPTHKFRILFGF